jgi:Protein of unknown function (DUF1194)
MRQRLRRLFRTIGVFCALVILAVAPPARAAEPVDLLLVLASDVSRSVTADKFKLQREGYAAAISNPQVLDAIAAGHNHRIAILFIEWAGSSDRNVVIDWTLIDGPKAALAFGDRLLEEPRSFVGRTSISGGIEFAMAQFSRAPFSSERQTIDVSGDGTNNAGRPVTDVRDEALRLGITINGLVILSDTPMPWNPEHTNPPGGLAAYYRENVVGGPGSFVIEAKDFNSFGQAIIKKLIAEIADATPVQSPPRRLR